MIVKLPIAVMFGDESVWEEEEKNRIIGNADVYGISNDGDQEQPYAGNGNDINIDDSINEHENDIVLESEGAGSEME